EEAGQMRPLSSLAMSIQRPPTQAPRRSSHLSYAAAALALVLAVAPRPGSAAPEPPDASAGSSLSCETLPRLLGAYLQNHVQYRALTEDLMERVPESTLRHLDPSRSLFVQADADKVKTELSGVFASLTRGDCSQLEDM